MPNISSNYDSVIAKKITFSERDNMATVVATLSYFTLIGWIIAMVINDNRPSPLAKFHLRQSLGLIITGAFLSFIPLIGWALNLAVIVAWAIGLCSAIQGNEAKVPVLGNLYQKHLDFIR